MSHGAEHGKTEHRHMHNVKPQESLIIKLSHVNIYNGFTASYSDYQGQLNFYKSNNDIMVVVLEPAVENICELFTHNPLTGAHVNPTLLTLMGIHK